MQVIGTGFGRTGTLSLKSALEILGFDRCYHMIEVMKHPRHGRIWRKVSEGKTVDWNKLFRGYKATVDFPASVFYPQLLKAYPDAKVLHTTRDSGRWYDSTLETIYQPAKLPRWVAPFLPILGTIQIAMDNKVWGKPGLFAGRFEEREFAIKVFEDYTAEVIRAVPAEQLLVFEVSQGWGPLCEFLGVPVPEVPFPHLNDRATMKRLITVLNYGPWLLAASLLGLLVWAVGML